jgi:preprotein translocase subunit SecB
MTDKTNNKDKQSFNIVRIYLKDSSFETPSGIEAFKQEWKPNLNIDINTKNKFVEDDNYEVELKLTVTVISDTKTVFIAEVLYAGIFQVKGLDEDSLDKTLESYCPTILLPYVRQEISSLSSKGSFPQVLVPPINFDAILVAKKQKKEELIRNSKENSTLVN